MCSLCRGNLSYVGKEMEISFTGDYCLLRDPKALFIGLLIKPNMIFLPLKKYPNKISFCVDSFFIIFMTSLFSFSAPSCPPAGVSCRGSGRGVVRVWWSQPPTHCSQTPVAGYTIVATPTTHTHHPSDSKSLMGYMSLCYDVQNQIM